MANYKDNIAVNVNGLNEFGELITDNTDGLRHIRCDITNYKYSNINSDGSLSEKWTMDMEFPFRKIQPHIFIAESLKNNQPVLFFYADKVFKFTNVEFLKDNLGRIAAFRFKLESV